MLKTRQISKEEFELKTQAFDSHPMQTAGWAELKEFWQAYDLEIDEKFYLLALAKKIPLTGKYFAYIPRISSKLNKQILESIADFFKKQNFSHIAVDPDLDYSFENLQENVKKIENIFNEAGFRKNGPQIQPSRTVVLDLLKNEQELLSDMRTKHRQYIRKAEKNGVTIVKGDESNLSDFTKIMNEIGSERGYQLHDGAYYKKVYEIFSKTNSAEIFLAKIGTEVVGSYMMIFSKSTAFEMYGGCNKKGNDLLASYLLKWETIKFSKSIGKKYYDQWGAEFKYPGLVQFKEGFGGYVVDFPKEYIYIYNKFSYGIYKILDKLNLTRQKFVKFIR